MNGENVSEVEKLRDEIENLKLKLEASEVERLKLLKENPTSPSNVASNSSGSDTKNLQGRESSDSKKAEPTTQSVSVESLSTNLDAPLSIELDEEAQECVTSDSGSPSAETIPPTSNVAHFAESSDQSAKPVNSKSAPKVNMQSGSLLEFTEDSPYFQEEISESMNRISNLSTVLQGLTRAAREWENAAASLSLAEKSLSGHLEALQRVVPDTVAAKSANVLASALHEVSQAREVGMEAVSSAFTTRIEEFSRDELAVCNKFHKRFTTTQSSYKNEAISKLNLGTKLAHKLGATNGRKQSDSSVKEHYLQQVFEMERRKQAAFLEYELSRFDLVVRLNRVALKIDYDLAEGLIVGAYSLLGFFHRCDDELSVTKDRLASHESQLQASRDCFLAAVSNANSTRKQLEQLGAAQVNSLADFSGKRSSSKGHSVNQLYETLRDPDQFKQFSTWILNQQGAHLPLIHVLECLGSLDEVMQRASIEVDTNKQEVLSARCCQMLDNLMAAIRDACSEDHPPQVLHQTIGCGTALAFQFWHEFSLVKLDEGYLSPTTREVVGKVELFFVPPLTGFTARANASNSPAQEFVTLEDIYAPRMQTNPRARAFGLRGNGRLVRRRSSFDRPDHQVDDAPARTQTEDQSKRRSKSSIRSRLRQWAHNSKSKASESQTSGALDTRPSSAPPVGTSPVPRRDASEIVQQGYLYKLSTGIKKDWKRRWFILYPDLLVYVRDEKHLDDPVAVCNCVVLTVRESPNEFALDNPSASGLDAFEILSPYSPRAYVLCAETLDEKEEWVTSLRSCTAQMLTDFSSTQPQLSASVHHGSVDGDPDRCCADCGAADCSWASLNLGVRLCIECSGVHRSLGVHVSKVRSVDLDRWLPEQRALLEAVGNTAANKVWEEDLPFQEGWQRPIPGDPRETKERFITAKYKWRGFVRSGEAEVVDKERVALYEHPAHAATEFGEEPRRNQGLCSCSLTMERLLHHASSEGNLSLVYFAVVHQADVAWQHPKTRRTALHVAALFGCTLCCELLCLNGASKCLEMRDVDGSSPVDLAMQNNHADVVELLEGKLDFT